MSVKELKDRLKDLNTQAQAAAGKDLDALLEEATTDVYKRQFRIYLCRFRAVAFMACISK